MKHAYHFSLVVGLCMGLSIQNTAAQRDTTRFDKWIFMTTPTTILNQRVPSFEIGAEYSPDGRWGYGVNYGFAVWEKEDRLFNDQTHNTLRLDLKRYRKRQINATYTGLELMLYNIAHTGDGTNYLGERNQSNLPIVKAAFDEFYWRASLKIGRRISADLWRIEWFLGLGIRQRNI
jgi:hypothetical protein